MKKKKLMGKLIDKCFEEYKKCGDVDKSAFIVSDKNNLGPTDFMILTEDFRVLQFLEENILRGGAVGSSSGS